MADPDERAMTESVAEWFVATDNPMKDVMIAVRNVIVEDPDITETIKYRAPAFEYSGILCYFNWSSKKRASLIFPSGQSIPGDHPALESGSNLQRMMYFADLADAKAKADDLRAVIAAYMATQD